MSMFLLNVVFFLVVFGIFFSIRIRIVDKNESILREAIRRYHLNCYIEEQPVLVEYYDIESFWDSVFHLLDFGYEHMLDREQMEIIRPYIRVDEIKKKR